MIAELYTDSRSWQSRVGRSRVGRSRPRQHVEQTELRWHTTALQMTCTTAGRRAHSSGREALQRRRSWRRREGALPGLKAVQGSLHGCGAGRRLLRCLLSLRLHSHAWQLSVYPDPVLQCQGFASLTLCPDLAVSTPPDIEHNAFLSWERIDTSQACA